jgi:formylglycine-generating enzyme required for sulfatase activity
MRNFVIWCVVLLAMAGTAFSQTNPPPKELAVDFGGGVKLEVVLIPAGEFLMGTPGDSGDEKQHKVRITKPFYLAKYEVTQGQWEAVMGSNPSEFKGPKDPVENVSWNDCQAFLGKLNAKTGGQGGKFVLPTEAQWEYACRAGSTTKYCFGDEEARLADYAWYVGNSGNKTHPVGEKKPNAWGLYDMHGNVWEWCADWCVASCYAKTFADDPRGPITGSYRVLRGGSWSFDAGFCRSACCVSNVPEICFSMQGLRVARVPADK